jgi:hypothetical protein
MTVALRLETQSYLIILRVPFAFTSQTFIDAFMYQCYVQLIRCP